MKVILASKSPRRKELLKEIINDFEVLAQDVEEISQDKRPDKKVISLAKLKLGNLPDVYKDCLIISADTIVYRKGEFFGKPKNREDAVRILKKLSDKKHYVYTGVAVYWQGKCHCIYDKSAVLFKKLDDNTINEYIDTGSPMDKAGAYGIQDRQVVKSYKGSYTNIVGLPVEKLKKLLDSILKA